MNVNHLGTEDKPSLKNNSVMTEKWHGKPSKWEGFATTAKRTILLVALFRRSCDIPRWYFTSPDPYWKTKIFLQQKLVSTKIHVTAGLKLTATISHLWGFLCIRDTGHRGNKITDTQSRERPSELITWSVKVKFLDLLSNSLH